MDNTFIVNVLAQSAILELGIKELESVDKALTEFNKKFLKDLKDKESYLLTVKRVITCKMMAFRPEYDIDIEDRNFYYKLYLVYVAARDSDLDEKETIREILKREVKKSPLNWQKLNEALEEEKAGMIRI